MTRKITQIVDEQVQRWRSESSERTERKPESFVPANVVTISRASGTFGGEVARQVGRILDLPVYDQEIVEHIAAKKNLRLETVNTLDEYAQSRLDDYVTALFREKNFDQSDYLRALTETIMGLWGHGPCVLVGRGAHQIVYRCQIRGCGNVPRVSYHDMPTAKHVATKPVPVIPLRRGVDHGPGRMPRQLPGQIQAVPIPDQLRTDVVQIRPRIILKHVSQSSPGNV